jgi:hypothetical protein
VRAIDARLVSQCLLRSAALVAQPAEIGGEYLAQV